MNRGFDPYFKWLGIPPEDQPADHYRLLGIPTFVSDADVIENAADQRMAHVRNFGTGQHAELSQRILNEIAAAKVTLLHPENKARYDDRLRSELSAKEQRPAGESDHKVPARPSLKTRSVPTAIPRAKGNSADREASPSTRSATPIAIKTTAPTLANRVQRTRKRAVWQWPAVVAAMLLAGVVMIAVTRDTSPPTSASSRAQVGDKTDRPPQRANRRPVGKKETETGLDNSIISPPRPGSGGPVIAERAATGADVTEFPMPVPPTPGATESNDGNISHAEVRPAGQQKAQPRDSAKPMGDPAKAGTDSEKATIKPRIPVPSGAALQAARQRAHATYAEIKATSQDLQGKNEAATQLVAKIDQRSDDPALVYVLLQAARALATETGDVELTAKIDERLDSTFELDVLQLRIESLTELATQIRTDRQRRALIESSDRLLYDLVAADRYDDVERIVRIATAVARRVRDGSLVKRLVARGRQIEQIEAAYRAVQRAQESGEDANLASGRFLSLFKGDWEEGIALLAKGGDQELSALARRELAMPSSPTDQIALADAWWELAERHQDLAQAHLRRHASTWYRRALPQASGQEKQRLEQRLAELAAPGSAESLLARPVDLLELIDVKRDSLKGAWSLDNGVLVSPSVSFARLQIPYEPPREYDLEVVVRRLAGKDGLGIGLSGFGGQVLLIVDQSTTGGDNGLDLVDGKQFERNETNLKQRLLADGKTHRIRISVRRSGITAVCDDKTIVNWEGDFQRLSLRDIWSVPNRKALFLTGHAGSHRIEKLTLVPVP